VRPEIALGDYASIRVSLPPTKRAQAKKVEIKG